MRVKVKMILDIDEQAWRDKNGLTSVLDVHDDVNEWAYELLTQAAQNNGVIPEGLRA